MCRARKEAKRKRSTDDRIVSNQRDNGGLFRLYLTSRGVTQRARTLFTVPCQNKFDAFHSLFHTADNDAAGIVLARTHASLTMILNRFLCASMAMPINTSFLFLLRIRVHSFLLSLPSSLRLLGRRFFFRGKTLAVFNAIRHTVWLTTFFFFFVCVTKARDRRWLRQRERE